MAMLSRRTSTTAIKWRQRLLTENHVITSLDHGWILIGNGVTITASPPTELGENFECQIIGSDALTRLGPTEHYPDPAGETFWVQRHTYPADDILPATRVNHLLHLRVIDGRLIVGASTPYEPFVFT